MPTVPNSRRRTQLAQEIRERQVNRVFADYRRRVAERRRAGLNCWSDPR